MKQFQMQVSTQTDNHNLRKNAATNKIYILRKISWNLKTLTFQNQHLMQNSILE